MEKACEELGLVDISTGRVWRFAYRDSPNVVRLEVHCVGRAAGDMSLKGTCRNLGHGRCGCWVTRKVEGAQRFQLLREMMEWASLGKTANRDEHYGMSQAIKRRYGMRV